MTWRCSLFLFIQLLRRSLSLTSPCSPLRRAHTQNASHEILLSGISLWGVSDILLLWLLLLFFFFCRNTCRVTESGGPLPAEPSGDNPHALLQAISDTLHRVPLQLRAEGDLFLVPPPPLKSVSEVSQWFSTFEIQPQMLSCHFTIHKFVRNSRQVKKSGFIA